MKPLETMRSQNSIVLLLAWALLLMGINVQAAPRPVPSPPSVSAGSYVVQDFHSGFTLAEKNADKRIEPASLTKLMSAYIVFRELEAGRLSLDQKITISEHAWRQPGSRTFLEVGSKVPVGTLLKGVIVQSGNDATVALAEQVAGSEDTFAQMMNQQAKAFGLEDTHFANSTGLPNPEHYSTARDIAKIARALIRDFPEYYKYYSEKEFTYNGISQYNRNKLLWRDKTVDGMKTGHTDSAGYCLVASAKRDDMRLVSVVVDDRSEDARASSSQALLNYGFRFFETRQLYSAGDALKKVPVWKGAADSVALGLDKNLYVTFPRGDYKKLHASIDYKPKIIAPVQRSQRYGTLNVSLDDKVVAERPLLALQNVEQGGWWTRLTDSVGLWFE
jgi:D-alanyl-D-alanine carboxypeptidase (penicillin-binding protein 5/6)